MPLGEKAWLEFPVFRGRFYVVYRPDRDKPQAERTYGPFQGDPFERLKLEDAMTQRLQKGPYAADDVYRIRLMLRTKDAGLARRAVRLMEATLKADVPLYQKENYLHPLGEILQQHAAALMKHGLEQETARITDGLAALDAEIERLTAEIPAAQYDRTGPIAVPEAIPPEAWGTPVNGLRVAAVPETTTARLGVATAFHLVVENVSDHDIKFSGSDLLQSAHAEVTGRNGQRIDTRTTFYTGLSPIKRYWLEAGKRMVLASPSLAFVEKTQDAKDALGCTKALAPPGAYTVRYTFGLGLGSSWTRGDGGVMRRISPAKGEWRGVLVSGAVEIAVKAE